MRRALRVAASSGLVVLALIPALNQFNPPHVQTPQNKIKIIGDRHGVGFGVADVGCASPFVGAWHPTASMTCSLLGSMTLTSVSLHTKVVMRMLDNGVRNLL